MTAVGSCLVDTNILLRIARTPDSEHEVVHAALSGLASEGTHLRYTHQNIAELWNALTRPVERNDLGLKPAQAEREVRAIEAGMSLLPENEAVYLEWRRIIAEKAVSGVQVHDARLVAAMRVHGVKHILTLNVQDFSRYDGIVVAHPSIVPMLLQTGRTVKVNL